MRSASSSQTQPPQARSSGGGPGQGGGQSRRYSQHHGNNANANQQQQHGRKASAVASSTSSSNPQPQGGTLPGSAPRHASSSSNPPVPLSTLLGTELKLVLNTGDSSNGKSDVQGTLWCYDASFGSLVLASPAASSAPPSTPSSSHAPSPSAASSTYRIVKLSSIQSVTVVPPPAAAATSSSSGTTPSFNEQAKHLELKAVDLQRLKERENEAVKAEYKRIEREPPPGVSPLGKELFEALGKTLPVRWAKEQIVVLEEVLVEPPYTKDAVKSNNPTRMERVIKVLTGETEKLRSTKPELFSTPTGAQGAGAKSG